MKFSLSAFAVKRPVTVFMASLTVVILGAIALQRIPLELLPKMDFPFIICFIPYPGGTPEQVENEIAIPAEGEFRTISQLKKINTTSNSDGCSVRMRFNWDCDMGLAAAEVRDRMERLKLKLPSQVDRLYLQRWSSTSIPVVVFSLSTTGDYEELAHLSRTMVKSRLGRVEGVADVQVHSKPEPEVLIQFDQNEMESRGLSLYQVVGDLQNASLNMSLGQMREGESQYMVRLLGELRTPEEIGATIVGANATRLRDVAEVGYDTREATQDFSIDGRSGVVIMVIKESEANTVSVCENVREELEDLTSTPAFDDIKYFTIFAQSDVITSALNSMIDAGKSGALLAIVVLFLFLSRIRPTLLVAISIPASVVVAFIYMFFMGMTLNLITMISMIIVLGMLVDNAIVVIENIYRYNQMGYDPVESAIRGASEVALAITASTITTIVVFVPILYLDSGEMSSQMKEFGAPLIVSLIASLFIALTIIPVVAARLKEMNPKTSPHRYMEMFTRFMRRRLGERMWRWVVFSRRLHPVHLSVVSYDLSLSWVLRHRMMVVGLMTGLLAFTYLLPFQKASMKEEEQGDRRQVQIGLKFDQNFDLEMARDTVHLLEDRINTRREELGIKTIFTNFNPGGGSIEIFLKDDKDLPPGAEYPYETDEVRDILWRTMPEKTPGVEINFKIAESAGTEGGSTGIALVMRGDDSRVLTEQAERLRQTLKSVLTDIDDVKTDDDRAREEIQVRVDDALANEAGLNAMTIAQTIDFALRGRQLPYLKQGGREVPVWAQFREEDRMSKSNLENVRLLTSTNELIPLNRLVEMTKDYSPQAIGRENGKNVTSLTITTRSKDMLKLLSQVKQVLAGFQLPQGYYVEFGETAEDMETAISNLIIALTLSCILVYLVMGALFESYILPLSILSCIPMAGIGVAWTMYLWNTPYDPVTFIGLILLVGVVVNNGIVLVDHINQLRLEGVPRIEALLQAGHDRYRPVMMTALTTILGCVPLAMGGSEIAFEGLGRALIGGLTAGTMLTLLLVPLVYTFFDDIRAWVSALLSDIRGIIPSGKNAPGAPTRDEVQ